MGQKDHMMVQKGLNMHEKGQKMEFLGQKGYIMVQKGLKMHKKRQKIEFLDLKNLLFSGTFLSEIGGYLRPP